MKLKGIVHLKIKILSSFSHPPFKTRMTDLLLRNLKYRVPKGKWSFLNPCIRSEFVRWTQNCC